MYWAQQRPRAGGVLFDPETTQAWCLCIYEAPMAATDRPNAITLVRRSAGPDHRMRRRSMPRRPVSTRNNFTRADRGRLRAASTIA